MIGPKGLERLYEAAVELAKEVHDLGHLRPLSMGHVDSNLKMLRVAVVLLEIVSDEIKEECGEIAV